MFRDKVKVELDLPNYATEKELDYAPVVDSYYLAARNYFTALKVKVDKLDIKNLVNAQTGLSNLKAKVGNLKVGNLKSVPVDLNKLSDAVNKKVVKKAKFDQLNMKLKILEKKKSLVTNTSVQIIITT